MVNTTTQLYARGIDVNWRAFHQGTHYPRVELPTYPFQKAIFALSPIADAGTDTTYNHQHDLLHQKYEAQLLQQLQSHGDLQEDELQFVPKLLSSLRKLQKQQSDLTTIAKNFYTMAWIESPLVIRRDTQHRLPASTAATWLILCNHTDAGTSLKQALLEIDKTFNIVIAASATHPMASTNTDKDGYILFDASRNDWPTRFLALPEIRQHNNVNIVFMTPDTIREDCQLNSEKLLENQNDGVLPLLELVQSLDQSDKKHALWIVTRGAIAGQRGLSMSSVWGAAKAIDLEKPGTLAAVIDIVDASEQATFDTLAQELVYHDGQKYTRYDSKHRYVQKLRHYPPLAPSPIAIHTNGSYLITGGTGGLGIRVAQYLVEAGAQHLILVSRTGCQSQQCQQALQKFTQAGVNVVVKSVDVGNPSAVGALFADIRDLPPLRGVVHAAGISGLDMIDTLDRGKVLSVLHAKLVGGWLLHQFTEALSLDFFVTFSSIASVWGSKGQYHYAAANAFLDALAHYRRHQGLPATSINWGPWDKGGMVDETGRELLKRIGIGLLSPDECITAFKHLLTATRPQVVYADVDWNTFKPLYASGTNSTFFSEILTTTDDSATHTTEAALPVPPENNELIGKLLQMNTTQRKRHLTTLVLDQLRTVLKLPQQEALSSEQGFFELGMDSLMALDLQKSLVNALGIDMPASIMFDTATPANLIEHINNLLLQKAQVDIQSVKVSMDDNATPLQPDQDAAVKDAIAIIGMACRFPGADSVDAFWSLLEKGECAVSKVPLERWDVTRYTREDTSHTGHHFGGFIDDIDLFDPHHFGITHVEANNMDPQQRILLEVSWRALEDAGFSWRPELTERTGVFIGITASDYLQLVKEHSNKETVNPHLITGNTLNAAAGRISYTFGFEGPCMSIDTACSSSLVAIHNACQSIHLGECNIALAGGVNALLAPENSLAAANANMLSDDGLCKTFDEQANGYVRGEGCGIVVLKRYQAALQDGDRIWGVIRGSALAQDGRSAALTAPNGHAQQKLINQAIRNAQVEPALISYVETHGTGTPLGDPIEINALHGVFGSSKHKDDPLLVGSVKTNVGHLESAAGVCSLIKVLLAFYHDTLPAHLHLRQPNRKINWHTMPIEVPQIARTWPRTKQPRVAGISSFGFTGTLAHLIVADAPAPSTKQNARTLQSSGSVPYLLTVSARSQAELLQLTHNYADFLKQQSNIQFADFAYTANYGRNHFPVRAAYLCHSSTDAATQLSNNHGTHGELPQNAKEVYFFITNENSANLCRGLQPLMENNTLFQQHFAQCGTLFNEKLPISITDAFHDCIAGNTLPADIEGPLQFSSYYALAQYWHDLGIDADAILAEGYGRYVAVCMAGIMTLPDCIEYLCNSVNASTSQTLLADITNLRPAMNCTLLATHADKIIELTLRDVDALHAYLLSTDEFENCILHNIPKSAHLISLHVGAQDILAPFASQFISVNDTGDYQRYLLKNLATLYVSGLNIKWPAFYHDTTRRIMSIPGYPLNRIPCWFDTAGPSQRRVAGNLDRNTESRLSQFVYRVDWQKVDNISYAPDTGASISQHPCLIIAENDTELANQLAHRLRQHNQTCILVSCSDRDATIDNSHWVVNAQAPTAFTRLFTELTQHTRTLGPILFIADSDTDQTGSLTSLDADLIQTTITQRCMTLIYLVQEMTRHQDVLNNPSLNLITRGAELIHSDKQLSKGNACIRALGRVIASEYRHWDIRLIDTPYQVQKCASESNLHHLINEIKAVDKEFQVCLREEQRFAPILNHGRALLSDKSISIRQDGCYVISGGLGAIGLRLAQHLTSLGASHIALISRRQPDNDVREHLERMRQTGTKITLLQLDLRQSRQLADAFNKLEQEGLPLRGVFHAAGILDDGTILNMDHSRLQNVCAAKIIGTTVLHQLTIGKQLDFFVCFSSMAAISGTAGQANYAVANAYLDAICREAQHQGSAYLSINWGPWGDSGMATKTMQGESYFMAQGIRPLSHADGLHLLMRLLGSDSGQLSVIDANWEMLTNVGISPALRELTAALDNMKTQQLTTLKNNDTGLLESLSRANMKEQMQIISQHVKQIVTSVVGIDLNEFNESAPLLNYGVDSLVMMQIGHKICDALRIRLDIADITSGIHTTKLAELIYQTYALQSCAKTDKPKLTADEAQALLDRFDKLAEADIDMLLDELVD
jgi:acyl transferase domain-containing protein/acyl carrier protein